MHEIAVTSLSSSINESGSLQVPYSALSIFVAWHMITDSNASVSFANYMRYGLEIQGFGGWWSWRPQRDSNPCCRIESAVS
jgi:hypothetical protein